MKKLSRCSIILHLTLSYIRITSGFSVNEVSHLTLLKASQTPFPILLNTVPSSLLASTAFIPTLQPQQGVLSLFNEYQSLLATHPLPTKLVTGAILAVAGDAVAQSRDRGDYDPTRGASFAAFDVTYRAVQNYLFPVIVDRFTGQYFLCLLEAVGLVSLSNIDVLAAMERALVNQLIVVPLFYYPVFFLFSGFQLGLTFDEGMDRAKENFLPLMKRNLLFWVPIQYTQFAFIPLDLQIPFLCLAGLIWTYILSILAGSTKKYSDEILESDEVYCVAISDDACILPNDELIPVPATVMSDNVAQMDNAVLCSEEDMLPELVMVDDFGQDGLLDVIELKRNTTVENALTS